MNWELVIITLIKIVVIVGVMFGTVTYLVYFERKISAWTQSRIGPNRVGPLGLFQSIADVIKLFLKEDIVPRAAIKNIHFIAPVLALFIAFSTYAVVPFGPQTTIFGYDVALVVADINMGILFVLALTSVGVYALTLSGWASGSKYSLLGGIRASAQMISYEISMGFSIGAVILVAGSLRPVDIVLMQSNWSEGLIWNAILQPIGFITFLVSAFAETNRQPFDLPEAEPELVGGFHTEYSSMKFAGFFLAEYANMIIASTLIVTLYLGGWHIPFLNMEVFPEWLAVLMQVGAFIFKVLLLLFFFLWVRWTVPRFRYDQLMNLGWKVMFPLALINLVWAAVLVMLLN
jgi:NADH-quinone oxidoreductase subunit H